jgi:hypothetical protein
MMFVTRAEYQEGCRAFDRTMQAMDLVLRDPRVIQEIGGLSMQLLEVAQSSFFPNLKDGRYVEPPSRAEDAGPAIIPMTDTNADHANELIAPLREDFIWQRPAASAGIFRPYNIDVAQEIEEMLNEGPAETEVQSSLAKGLRPNSGARTQALVGISEDGLCHVTSRPVVTIREKHIAKNLTLAGAIAAHEAVHALDILENPLGYATLSGGVASELRAYHVTAAVYETGLEPPKSSDSAFWVEGLRRAMLRERQLMTGQATDLYAPSPAVVEQMVARGIV